MKAPAAGTLVRVGTGSARYRVTRVEGDLVHVFGGKGGRLSARVFPLGQVTVLRDQTKDPNAHWREAIHEVSARSKARRGRR